MNSSSSLSAPALRADAGARRARKVDWAAAAFWGSIAGLAFFRLWMLSVQRLTVYGSGYDDLLFVRQARSIAAFQWLGPYDSMVLTKGPGYPIWVAVLSWLHVPLLLGEQLFDIFACVLLVVAIRPGLGAIRSRFALLVIFFVVLINPVAAGPYRMEMVMRDSIYPDQCLILAGCLIGIMVRVRAGQSVLFWLVGAGLSMGWIYISREEGIWVPPLVAAALGYATWKVWRMRRVAEGLERRRWRWGWLMIPLIPAALALAIVGTISTINWRIYGMFGVSEIKEKNFQRALGAVQRVTPKVWIPMVSEPRETWGRLAAVSPAFAKVKPVLEGPSGAGWAMTSAHESPELAGTGEIAGGWFMWAFREAADAAGMHKNARAASAFYGQMADEINGAIESGKLAGGAKSASLIGPWRWAYVPLMTRALPAHLEELIWLTKETPETPRRSLADAAAVAATTQLVHQAMMPNTAKGESAVLAKTLPSRRYQMLWIIYYMHDMVAPFLAVASLAIFGVMVWRRNVRAMYGWAVVTLTGVMGAVVLRTLVLVLIDVASFPAQSQRYSSATEIYVLLAEGLCLGVGIDLWVVWGAGRRGFGKSVGVEVKLPGK